MKIFGGDGDLRNKSNYTRLSLPFGISCESLLFLFRLFASEGVGTGIVVHFFRFAVYTSIVLLDEICIASPNI